MESSSHRVDGTESVHNIATFGDSQLVRHISGLYELRGGSAGDHTDAKEWISLFLHEAVVSFPSPVARQTRSTGLARCAAQFAKGESITGSALQLVEAIVGELRAMISRVW